MVEFSGGIPLAVATGSFWPVSTLESIQWLLSSGIGDIELTLQMTECALGFHHELRMPIEKNLDELQRANHLHIQTVHTAHLITEHGFSTRARGEFLAHTIQLTHRLNADLLVVHPSHLFTSFEESQSYLSGQIEPAWKVLLPQMADLFELARSLGVKIALENVMEWDDDEGFYFNSPENLAKLINDVPYLGITQDILHSCIAGNLYNSLEQIGPFITNLHLADWKPPYSRVTPGQGNLNWPGLLPVLKKLPNLRHATIELSSASMTDVNKALNVVMGAPGDSRRR